MNNIEFLSQFSLLPNKYIILYIDTDNIFNINLITSKYKDLGIIRFLLKNENKQNINIHEIYPDTYSEDNLIKNCLCIVYLSKIKRSDVLIRLIELYNKYVIYEDLNILNNIDYIVQNDTEKNTLFEENREEFKKIYNNFTLTSNKNILLEDNIKLEYNKIFKDYIHKITIITYFKNSDIKILNIIQKKSIIENLKNKNVHKVIVLGNNIINEFQDSSDNLELIEYAEEVTYKDLIDVSNRLLNDSIVCILRSDIILPNQNELYDLNIDLSDNNVIYTISRIERLINGNLVKSEKIYKTLQSIEQDAWIFKSPLNINAQLFHDIYFYHKYSELYFHNILTLNNYKIINNSSKIKIIRLLHENNIDNRLLVNNTDVPPVLENIYLVPDNELLNKLSIDNLFQLFNIHSDDIYNIKLDIFNKYIKKNIF